MRNKKHTGIKAAQIDRIVEILFSDADVSPEDMAEIRRWLITSDSAELKEKALFDKFVAGYSGTSRSRYARELWPVIADKLGMTVDLDELLTKRSVGSDTALREGLLRESLSKRQTVRTAVVLIPALIAVGVTCLHWGKWSNSPAAVPVLSGIVADTLKGTTSVAVVTVADTAAQPKEAVHGAIPELATVASEVGHAEATVYDIVAGAPKNRHRYLKLPDSSTVIINNGGHIEYSTQRRELKLYGEAYFIVAKGSDVPFRVITQYCSVTVTGTEFNVNADSASGHSMVDLIEGSVTVSAGGNNIDVLPMESLDIEHGSGVCKISRCDGNNWWEQPISFKAFTLRQILENLDGYYGIGIDGAQYIGDTMRYTIKFDKLASPDHIMNTLTQIAPGFRYEKTETGITVSMKAS